MLRCNRSTSLIVEELLRKFLMTVQFRIVKHEDLFEYWLHLLIRSSCLNGQLPDNYPRCDVLCKNSFSFLVFIYPDEVIPSYASWHTSVGQNSFKVSVLRTFHLVSWQNCTRYGCTSVGRRSLFADSRTIFLPKKRNTNKVFDLKPISIASVFVRHFHLIVNACLLKFVSISCH